MRVKLTFLLALFFVLSACLNGVFRANPTQAPPIKLEATPLSVVTGPVQSTASTTTPTATPTAEMDRSRENGQALAARVNQQPVYLITYDQQVSRLTETLTKQGVDLNSPAGQAQMTRTRQQVFEALIDQVIIEQEAARRGLSITASELEAALQAEFEQSESPADRQAWLAANSLSDEELRGILRAQLLANRLLEQVSAGIPATAAQAQVQYIRVTDEATAHLIVEQLKQGVDFSRLAQEYSTTEAGWSGGNGAEPGWIAQGAGVLPAEVETIAFGLQPGQMNGPIPTPAGFYIIKLLNKETARPISQTMAQSFKKQIFLDWLAAQRSAATIERFVDW